MKGFTQCGAVHGLERACGKTSTCDKPQFWLNKMCSARVGFLPVWEYFAIIHVWWTISTIPFRISRIIYFKRMLYININCFSVTSSFIIFMEIKLYFKYQYDLVMWGYRNITVVVSWHCWWKIYSHLTQKFDFDLELTLQFMTLWDHVKILTSAYGYDSWLINPNHVDCVLSVNFKPVTCQF